MIRFALFVLLTLLSRLFAYSQAITLGTIPSPFCIDSVIEIPISTTGIFAANNTFQVQLSRGYYVNNTEITSYPGEFIDGKLRVTLKNLPYQDYQLSGSFYARVVSTSPVTQSNWSDYFYLRVPPTITLSSQSDAINAYDPFVMQLKGRGSSPLTVTFNDSLTKTYGDSYSDITINQLQTLNPARKVVFRITNVRNVCGTGLASGTAEVKINPVSLRITSLSASALCVGSTLRLNYDKAQGDFGPGNKFKIRITRTTDGTRSVELDAIEENGFLKVVLPNELFMGSDYLYTIHQVRLISSQPAIVSAPAETTLYVYPSPSASLTTASQTIDMGQLANINIRSAGILPFSAVFNDGMVTLLNSSFSEMTRVVQPTQPTSYSLSTFSTGCGQTDPDHSVLFLNVRSSMMIDSVPDHTVCEGQTVQLRTVSNAVFSPSATYTVTFIQEFYDRDVITVPATYADNKLTFVIPTLPVNTSNNSMSYRLRVKVTDSQVVYSGPITTLPFHMQLRPKAVIIPSKPITINNAGDPTYLNLDYVGGGPYTVTMSDGSVYFNNTTGDNYTGTLVLFPLQSGTYSVKEIKNQCFTGSSTGSYQLNVTDATKPGLLLQPFLLSEADPKYRCSQDSLPVQYSSFGKFEASNSFSIQVQKDYGSWVTVATNVKQGITRIMLNPGNFQVRIASSNPLLYSQPQAVQVAQLPVASLSSDFNGGNTLMPVVGESRSLLVNVTGGIGPYRVVLSDGTNSITRTISSSLREQVRITNSVSYSIRSVTDQCGISLAQTAPISYTAQALQIALTMSTGFSCPGSALTLPFSILGVPSTNTTYQLQIARTTGVFTNLGEAVKQSPFNIILPADIPANTYQFRVLISNPDVVSGLYSLEIRNKPTATLTTDSGLGEVSGDFGAVQLKLVLTGGGKLPSSYQVVFNDDFVGQYTDNNSFNYREVYPSKRTTYSLKSVANGCGFGTVNGQVLVNVKPAITLQTTLSSVNPACVGKPISVSYTSRGEFGVNNIFRLYLVSYNTATTSNVTRLRLDSSRSSSGSFNVIIPATLTPNSYQLELVASDPSISALANVYVSATPQVIISGNTLINAGQTAYLMLTPSRATANDQGNTEIILSNGQRLTSSFTNTMEPTYVGVMPTQTTSYTITSLRNSCGVGQASGNATVTVNAGSINSISVIEVGNYSTTTRACAGDTIQITYAVSGSLPSGSSLIAQLSDSTGANFTDITTVSVSGKLVRAILPSTLPRGNGYRLIIRSSSATVTAGAYPYPLRIRYRATAKFSVSSVVYQAGKPAQVAVLLGGDGPWLYRIATDLTSINHYASKSPDTISLQAVSPNVFYKLSSVSNDWCSFGQLLEPTTLRVELLTAIDPATAMVMVSPNPTIDQLDIVWAGQLTESYDIQLSSLSGLTILSRISRLATEKLSLVGLPTGVYLLRVQKGVNIQVFRIVKQ